MARYTGPKNRLARRIGSDLGLKTVGSKSHAGLLRKLNIPPGMHGQKRQRKQSDYGLQLKEKQKARFTYGVLEKQFRRYFHIARKTKGATGAALLQILERRLDNVVYRLGLAPTRTSARQIISHGHVNVNSLRVNIPSYLLKKDDVISLRPKITDSSVVKKMLEEKNPVVPSWLERQGPAGKVARIPQRDEIESDINEQLIVEYYSR